MSKRKHQLVYTELARSCTNFDATFKAEYTQMEFQKVDPTLHLWRLELVAHQSVREKSDDDWLPCIWIIRRLHAEHFASPCM